MNVIKLKRNDADYDKSKSVKSESVGYISKKHFKGLECEEKNIQGFFCFKKGKSENRISTENNSFDLKNKKPKFSFIKGYVKSIDGSFYAFTTRNILSFLLLLILLLGMLFVMKSCSDGSPISDIWKPTIDQFVYDNENGGETVHKDITICGFTDWTVQSGKAENLPISLKNPEGNPCYFTFQIELEDGTQLYQSSHVPPGNEIRQISLSQPLQKGTYTAYVSILTNEINTGTPMNSAKIKITINVI